MDPGIGNEIKASLQVTNYFCIYYKFKVKNGWAKIKIKKNCRETTVFGGKGGSASVSSVPYCITLVQLPCQNLRAVTLNLVQFLWLSLGFKKCHFRPSIERPVHRFRCPKGNTNNEIAIKNFIGGRSENYMPIL